MKGLLGFEETCMSHHYTRIEWLVIIGFIVSLLVFPLVVLLTLQRVDESEMTKHANEISTAITRLRQYYADDVVGPIQDAGGRAVVSESYKDIEGGIPIPATFSIELGEIFHDAHRDTKLGYAFVSDYPFTTRQGPGLDDFQKRALAKFRSDPTLAIYKEDSIPLIGEGRLRMATPVQMQASCLSCHNSHPGSTKRDWKVNDIRGIQEVSVGSIKNDIFDYSYLFAYFLMLMSLASGSTLVFRNSANKLRASNQLLEQARRAEEDSATKLKAQLQQLQLLGAVADRSTFGVTIADCRQTDRPLIYVNDSFCRMTGLTKEQSIGRNCRFLAGPQTDVETRVALRRAIEAGLPHTVEILNYKADGTTFWNRLTVFPVGGKPGQPDYYVGYQVDVTDMRKAEQERAVMMAEIQEGKKMESLGILVAGVAHEINNPLGIALTATSHISQSAQRLSESLASQGLLNPGVNEFLEDEREAYKLIETNLMRAAVLVRNFKEVASDRSQDSIRQVNLAVYLETLIGSFTPMTKRNNTKVSLDAEHNIDVAIDTGSFGQLITNLVLNALTHAFDGVTDQTIEIAAKKEGGLITVTVCDNGNGIAANVMPHLFDPFYTTKRSTGGTGLGLFIARRIATETLHGDLYAENRPTGGACFCLKFPDRGSE